MKLISVVRELLIAWRIRRKLMQRLNDPDCYRHGRGTGVLLRAIVDGRDFSIVEFKDKK